MVKINKIEELENRRNFFRNLEVLEIFLFRKFLVLDTYFFSHCKKNSYV